jgi:4-diphosphocytidyl-2C-methyl-D-erythritol kinase
MTGSDINFFVSDESFARCTGRGEIIMGLPIPEDMPDDILLIIPPVHASTPEVYREFSIKEKDNSDIDTVLYNLYVKGWEETGNMLFNSLETPAFKLYNKLLELSESMNREKLCCMSGSGASFFVFGPERDIEHDDCEVHRVSIWRENE